MIFISDGKAIYVQEECEPKLLTQSQWACEAVLWVPWVHRGEMLAKSDCNVLAMAAHVFREVVLCHPAHLGLPRRYAVAFANKLTEETVAGGNVSDIFGEESEGFLADILKSAEKRTNTLGRNDGSGSLSRGIILPSRTLQIISTEDESAAPSASLNATSHNVSSAASKDSNLLLTESKSVSI